MFNEKLNHKRTWQRARWACRTTYVSVFSSADALGIIYVSISAYLFADNQGLDFILFVQSQAIESDRQFLLDRIDHQERADYFRKMSISNFSGGLLRDVSHVIAWG